MVVQNLAAHREDDRERDVAPCRQGDPPDETGHLALDESRTHEPHGVLVHVPSDLDGAVHLGDLGLGLDQPLVDHGLHERARRVVVGRLGRDAERRLERDSVLGSILRQKVDRSIGAPGRRQRPLELSDRHRMMSARRRGEVDQRRLRAHPHHVGQGGLGAEQGRLRRVGVDRPGEIGHVEPKVVAERSVLPEAVGVVGVVHRAEPVPRQEDQATADAVGEAGAALRVDVGFEQRASRVVVVRGRSVDPTPDAHPDDRLAG
jgi:hypothetical protein